MSPDDGSLALGIAREAIEQWIRKENRIRPSQYPESFDEKTGCFVTINTYPKKELRGCIGYPEPVMPFIDALVEAAISATKDPRFPRIKRNELPKITVELSVLTKPKEIDVKNPSEYPKHVKVGRDGLIVTRRGSSGLLLPQVAVEWGWTPEEFLMQTCLKAGLPPDEWKNGNCMVETFQSVVFQEEKPPY